MRDLFGRYPYKESVQQQYGFVEVPVVNYYFDILKTAIEQAYQLKLKRKLWPEHSFATCITHDIDRLNSAWKVWGTEALKAGNIKSFLKLFSQKWLKNDVWNNLEEVQQTVEKYGACSTFFFLSSQDKFNNHPAADYAITSPEVKNQLKKLATAGHEIGVHGSFGTATDLKRFLTQIQKISQKTVGNRFHYLIYEPKKTPQVLEEAGLRYDSTLGFAEHFGFRNSYCFPFQPYDFENKKPHHYIEIPLNLMDTTLLPHYLNIQPQEVLAKVKPMLQHVEKFGGCFTLLWHNEHLANQEQQGKYVLEQLLQYCKSHGTGFYLCREVTGAGV
ncbi:MAG: polysaccharide deacetylase family protein [Hymenobacteraceae bacterium]|nr:polysaccharide deacetylase family protein [Hymenobacteraceae bacterium]MDX5395384.1 polysaccharide deacetylase family protein [Hymenobacteraceae bacterium]MDX5511433.1 polysaccharide deacetylase family protein [Hymenobacteraceae bacterium]